MGVGLYRRKVGSSNPIELHSAKITELTYLDSLATVHHETVAISTTHPVLS